MGRRTHTHIHVLVTEAFGFAQTDPVNDRGVVKSITDNSVLICNTKEKIF